GWTAIGSPNPDYSAAPLHGAQSLRCTGSQLIRRSFQYSSSFYMYFQARWLIWSPFNNVVDWEDSNTATTASVYADSSKLLLMHGGVQALGSTTILENTTYHIWVEWTRGSGNNGTMRLYLSTSGIKPSTPDASISNGTGQAVNRIFVGPFGSGMD